MVARIDDIAVVRIDDAGEATISVAVWAILAHTAGPNAVKLVMAAATFTAQRVPLVRPRVAALIAHHTPAVPHYRISTIGYLAAGVTTAAVNNCNIVAHGGMLGKIGLVGKGIG